MSDSWLKIVRDLGKAVGEFQKAVEEVQKPIEQTVKDVRDGLSEPPLLVFVSSIMNPKCDDLAAERAAAKKAIEALPLSRSWRFEDSPASPETASRVYLRKVRECDIFVLVLGKEITHPVLCEYATARKHKRMRLAFLKKCERTPATQSFVHKIGGEVTWKDFGAALDLERQIQIAIADLLLLKWRNKLTANEIAVLTGFLSQVNKVIETPTPQLAEPETPAPRVQVLEPKLPLAKVSAFLESRTYGLVTSPSGEVVLKDKRGLQGEKIIELFKRDNRHNSTTLRENIRVRKQFHRSIVLSTTYSGRNLDEGKARERIYTLYHVSQEGISGCVIPAEVPADEIYEYVVEWTQIIREGTISEVTEGLFGNQIGAYRILIDMTWRILGVYRIPQN
ncbi:MAG: DUF4062 domain-containing protein [Chloroflexi bacterium]|nr:DUF4062 domain-containing protein [Chloroflexota bacterium]